MFRRALAVTGVLLAAGLGAAACYNSESDYKALLEENEALSAELASARQENEILARALENIKREQETLQLLLNAGKSGLMAGRLRPAAGAQEPEASPPAGAPASAVQAAASRVPSAAEEWRTPGQAAAQAASAGSAARVYVIKPGDVLSRIAEDHHTTVAKILELNPQVSQRRGHMIYDNEKLKLP